MNILPHITCLSLFSLCSLSPVFADEAQPETHGPVIEPLQKAPANPKIQVEVRKLEEAEIIVCKKRPAPQTEAIPKMYAKEKAVVMKMEALVRNQGHYQVKLRIINPTDMPMTFTGFSETSPITKTQLWKGDKWVDKEQFLRCGTGLRQCTIAPGQSAVFNTSLQGDLLPARIGLVYMHGGKERGLCVWSDKIER